LGAHIKSNLISLIITGVLFVASSVIFLVFTNADIAKNSDIDTSASSDNGNKAVYYAMNNGEFTKVTEKATGDFGKSFSDIQVMGELSDSNGNIGFVMENGKITASYLNQSNAPDSYSYNYLSYELDKKYTVDSDVGSDEMFQGYVYYPTAEESDEDNKELCKYLESNSYFTMSMCEDKENVYTVINTAQAKRNNTVDSIKNNAIYRFDKDSRETKRLIDVNIHTEGQFIEAIACNDKYIYLLINASEKFSLKIYDKESMEEVKTKDLDIYVDLESFAKIITKEYAEENRKVSNYEIQEQGYNLYASDTGLVAIRKSVVAEIDEKDPKHYGEKGYSNVYDEKGIEPFVKEVYTVSSYNVDGKDVKIDNTHICMTNYMYDYVVYKNGLTYILTNEYSSDSDVLEKIKVTSLSNGKVFEEININLNKISTTSGSKELKYLAVK